MERQEVSEVVDELFEWSDSEAFRIMNLILEEIRGTDTVRAGEE